MPLCVNKSCRGTATARELVYNGANDASSCLISRVTRGKLQGWIDQRKPQRKGKMCSTQKGMGVKTIERDVVERKLFGLIANRDIFLSRFCVPYTGCCKLDTFIKDLDQV